MVPVTKENLKKAENTAKVAKPSQMAQIMKDHLFSIDSTEKALLYGPTSRNIQAIGKTIK